MNENIFCEVRIGSELEFSYLSWALVMLQEIHNSKFGMTFYSNM